MPNIFWNRIRFNGTILRGCLEKKKYISHDKHFFCKGLQKLEFNCILKNSYSPSIYLDYTIRKPNRKVLLKQKVRNYKLQIATPGQPKGEAKTVIYVFERAYFIDPKSLGSLGFLGGKERVNPTDRRLLLFILGRPGADSRGYMK